MPTNRDETVRSAPPRDIGTHQLDVPVGCIPEKTVSLYRLPLTGAAFWRHLVDEQIDRRIVVRRAGRNDPAADLSRVCGWDDIPDDDDGAACVIRKRTEVQNGADQKVRSISKHEAWRVIKSRVLDLTWSIDKQSFKVEISKNNETRSKRVGCLSKPMPS